jgi:NADH dehydrogenase
METESLLARQEAPRAPAISTPIRAEPIAVREVPEPKRAQTNVVILGGGFGGVYAAQYLTRKLGRRKDVHVELLSEENYFVFQPLLPEVAAGGINPNHVVNPIRELVPRAQFRWCRVQRVDTEKKQVLVAQGAGLELIPVPYDHLVVALGKVSDFSSMPGVAEHSLPMKDLGDAYQLRNHVLRCLELADVEPDPALKRALCTFVVAGGGFSGVETIGELHELVERSLRYFRNVNVPDVRFVLIHSREALLPEMPPSLGVAAKRILSKRGIEMALNVRVRAASPQHVYLSSGAPIAARTFVCTVGNGANPVVKDILQRGGFTEAQLNGKGVGVFQTDEQLRCVGRVGYWAVGDCAGIPLPDGGGLAPATAQFAIREAKTCAENILATIDGKELKPFRFKVLGMLASLGRRAAVADLMGVKLSGAIAWFMWRTIYLSKLPGLGRKVRVALDWTLDLFFPRDITQFQLTRVQGLRVHHYEPGEVILEEGDLGREFYIIRKGEVQVYKTDERGFETPIAKLKDREVFGEKALIEDTKRGASVRALTPVDVLVLSRGDFRAMVTQFDVLEEYFEKLLQQRYPGELPIDVRLIETVAPSVKLPK